jgi:uncharacterized OsmC-like protein
MSSQTILDAVRGATAYLAAHPNEARYRDSHARARLGAGLRVEVVGPGGERVRTDMPKGIGGTAKTPSPGWLLRAATASCVASLIGIRAAMLEVALDDVDVLVDSESDDRGILGLDAGVDAGALSMRIEVLVTAPGADRATIESIVGWAVDHCPVADTVRRAVPLEIVIAQ